MKNLFVTSLLIAFSCYLSAQTNKVVIGTIDTLNSKILNEKRTVWVYVPNHGSDNNFSKRRYPVVYLLDGGAHFYSVVGMIQQLSSVNGNTICPEMIVVGITNTDRTRDLTPTRDTLMERTSGGNEKFISFIEKELIPYIDSQYPTEPYRMFIGHSFGGLTVINTLVHHTNLFNAYVAIDPSMWWDKQSSLKETEKALSEKNFKNVYLYLGTANTMEEGMDTLRVKKDTSRFTQQIRSGLELNSHIKKNKQNALNYQFKFYSTDNHGSVPLIATYDALHFIFSYYTLNLTFKDFTDTTMAYPQKLVNHYKNISEKLGYNVSSEDRINAAGYGALSRKNYSHAEYFFKVNVNNYPESSNVYDSLGDYYVAVGDKPNAIVNFTKALSIQENPDTREKLGKLQAK